MKSLFALVLTISISFSAFAASVDTISVESPSMKKAIKCVVITPSSGLQNKDKKFPTTYLLHGYGGWYANWIIRVPELKEQADLYQMIIVCPDGKNNWYLDSPVNDSIKFETFVGVELPAFIDAHYPTISNRKARAITGLSMGGHGGLFLGFRHSETFGACGSMSGAADIRPFKKNWELASIVGDTINHLDNWDKYSVINVVDNKPTDILAIIIDCGSEDFFYEVNKQLHEKLLTLKIKHDFIVRPGKHEWPYWKNSIRYQLLFFSDYFNKP
jgi:S-formylglutathione hydrolase FrmB